MPKLFRESFNLKSSRGFLSQVNDLNKIKKTIKLANEVTGKYQSFRSSSEIKKLSIPKLTDINKKAMTSRYMPKIDLNRVQLRSMPRPKLPASESSSKLFRTSVTQFSASNNGINTNRQSIFNHPDQKLKNSFSLDYLLQKINGLKFNDDKFAQDKMKEIKNQAPGAFERSSNFRSSAQSFLVWYKNALQSTHFDLEERTDINNLCFSWLFMILKDRCQEAGEVLRLLFYDLQDFIATAISGEVEQSHKVKKDFQDRSQVIEKEKSAFEDNLLTKLGEIAHKNGELKLELEKVKQENKDIIEILTLKEKKFDILKYTTKRYQEQNLGLRESIKGIVATKFGDEVDSDKVLKQIDYLYYNYSKTMRNQMNLLNPNSSHEEDLTTLKRSLTVRLKPEVPLKLKEQNRRQLKSEASFEDLLADLCHEEDVHNNLKNDLADEMIQQASEEDVFVKHCTTQTISINFKAVGAQTDLSLVDKRYDLICTDQEIFDTVLNRESLRVEFDQRMKEVKANTRKKFMSAMIKIKSTNKLKKGWLDREIEHQEGLISKEIMKQDIQEFLHLNSGSIKRKPSESFIQDQNDSKIISKNLETRSLDFEAKDSFNFKLTDTKIELAKVDFLRVSVPKAMKKGRLGRCYSALDVDEMREKEKMQELVSRKVEERINQDKRQLKVKDSARQRVYDRIKSQEKSKLDEQTFNSIVEHYKVTYNIKDKKLLMKKFAEMYEAEHRERLVLSKKYNGEVGLSLKLKADNTQLIKLVESLEKQMEEQHNQLTMYSKITKNPSLKHIPEMKELREAQDFNLKKSLIEGRFKKGIQGVLKAGVWNRLHFAEKFDSQTKQKADKLQKATDLLKQAINQNQGQSKKKGMISKKTVLKHVSQLYMEKIKEMKYKPEKKNQPMLEFIYDYYMNNFGFKKIAEPKFKGFIRSLKRFQDNFRIAMFTKFLGMHSFEQYSQDQLNKYLECLEYM